MCSYDIFLGLVAILFPPVTVWAKCGLCSADLLINICLCVLGFLPGLLHAWYIVAKFPEHDYDSVPQDLEAGHGVAYIVVRGPDGRSERVQRRVASPVHPAYGGYGATAPVAPAVHQAQNGSWNNDPAVGSSDGAVPPTYAEVLTQDNKVQSDQ